MTGYLLVACGGGGGSSPAPEAGPPTIQDTGNDPPTTSGDGEESANEPTDNDIGDSGSGDDAPNAGDGGANPGDDARNTDDGITNNSAPSIAGTPTLSVVQNSVYELVVSASDPDGDSLNFIAINKPDWTSFDLVTGVLLGTPTATHIGTTDEITIGVTDGVLTTFLPPFRITVYAFGHSSATLSWTIPSTNEDGTPLTDLAGFRVYYGTRTGNYTETTTVDNPGVSSLVVDNLSIDSTYFFVMTAFDASGNESKLSNEASKAF